MFGGWTGSDVYAVAKDFQTLIAALLPCFWLYWDVGNAIARVAAQARRARPALQV